MQSVISKNLRNIFGPSFSVSYCQKAPKIDAQRGAQWHQTNIKTVINFVKNRIRHAALLTQGSIWYCHISHISIYVCIPKPHPTWTQLKHQTNQNKSTHGTLSWKCIKTFLMERLDIENRYRRSEKKLGIGSKKRSLKHNIVTIYFMWCVRGNCRKYLSFFFFSLSVSVSARRIEENVYMQEQNKWHFTVSVSSSRLH